MLIFYVEPFYRDTERTISLLRVSYPPFVQPHSRCFILEDTVREIAGEPVSRWKVPGRTAIPAGVYPLTLEYSPKFGPDTLTIHDVPGFAGIRVHPGEDVSHTEGCPLPGYSITHNLRITPGTSRPAWASIRELVKDARAQKVQPQWHVRR